jgi:hypothetical protein
MVDYREEFYGSNHWAHSRESMIEGRKRVEDRIVSRTITFQDARIDIDGDGVAERILKFRDGRCLSKLYWVDLYVVSNDGPWIDGPRTKAYFHRDSDEAARVPFYAKPQGRYDAFLYRGTFYSDIWVWDEVSEAGYPSAGPVLAGYL